MPISVYSISKNSKLLGLGAGFAVFVLAVSVLLWYVAQGVGAAEDLAGSSDPNDRKQAVERLRGKKSVAARRVLSALSKDTDKWVAIRAVRTLSENRGADSRDLLEKIVQDRSYNPSARGEAAAELGKFKNVDPALLTRALIGDTNAETRAGAAKGLTRLRKPETLVKALEDKDARVRIWAITGIHKMIARRFPYDARKPPHTQRQEILRIRQYLKSCNVLP
jgi:HEAT repeat protein